MNENPRRWCGAGALALALVVSAGACGDDDDATGATIAPAGEPSPTDPVGTDRPDITPADTTTDTTSPRSGQPVDFAEFCSTVIGTNAAVSAGPDVDFETATDNEMRAAMDAFADAVVPLLDQLSIASPDEVSDEVATIDSALRASFETGDDPFGDPVVIAADRTIDRFMADNCGYEMITVRGLEYAFEGAPSSLARGTVGFEFDNQGNEVHEMLVMRINDGVDATVEELLKLPEHEAMSMTQYVGAAFAGPGETDTTFMELAPGRYVMLCFVPVGTVSMGDGPPPAGSPHVMQGMVHEFEVS